jgi:hypothetical protein
MTPAAWRKFLTRYSRELLADVRVRSSLSKAVISSGWLGFAPATTAQLSALEKRIGARLPPSYRNFLKTTNGWRATGPFIDRVFPARRVAWFRDRHQDWLDAWLEGARCVGEPIPVSDEEHRVYGAQQDCCKFRQEYWEATLAISGVGDSAIYLLNPLVVTRSGEWEAWFFANWHPGAVRYRSFAQMLEEELRSFIELRDGRE